MTRQFLWLNNLQKCSLGPIILEAELNFKSPHGHVKKPPSWSWYLI